MSRRQDQFAAVLREAVQEVIEKGLNDPRVQGMITVTGVRVSPDLADAFVSVSVLPEDKQTLTMHGLRAGTAYIWREVGKLVDSRRLPKLYFEVDSSTKTQAKVLDALSKIQDHERPKGWGQPPKPEGEA